MTNMKFRSQKSSGMNTVRGIHINNLGNTTMLSTFTPVLLSAPCYYELKLQLRTRKSRRDKTSISQQLSLMHNSVISRGIVWYMAVSMALHNSMWVHSHRHIRKRVTTTKAMDGKCVYYYITLALSLLP